MPPILAPDALDYAEASKAISTRRAYASHWYQFVKWCDEHHAQSLPAHSATVANYISTLAGRLKAGTIERRLSATLPMPTNYKGTRRPQPRPRWKV